MMPGPILYKTASLASYRLVSLGRLQRQARKLELRGGVVVGDHGLGMVTMLPCF